MTKTNAAGQYSLALKTAGLYLVLVKMNDKVIYQEQMTMDQPS